MITAKQAELASTCSRNKSAKELFDKLPFVEIEIKKSIDEGVNGATITMLLSFRGHKGYFIINEDESDVDEININEVIKALNCFGFRTDFNFVAETNSPVQTRTLHIKW